MLDGVYIPPSAFDVDSKITMGWNFELDELGVEVIHAHSPQAKGRIERLFGVLQDRLIKEIRLKGVKTREEANEFLKWYLPVYNRKFRMVAANKADVHVKPPKRFNLDKHLCVKTVRTVRNDNTIAHNGKLYQIEERATTKKVIVKERFNGSLHIVSDGNSLKYSEITERPEKEKQTRKAKPGKAHVPPMDYPWRQYKNRHPTSEQQTFT